jgi:hypothetical protein
LSLFKKIVSKILNQDEQQDDPNVTKLADQLRNADLDYKFAQLFTASGGFFNYCGDEAEALQVLIRLLKLRELRMFFVVMITYRIF